MHYLGQKARIRTNCILCGGFNFFWGSNFEEYHGFQEYFRNIIEKIREAFKFCQQDERGEG